MIYAYVDSTTQLPVFDMKTSRDEKNSSLDSGVCYTVTAHPVFIEE